MRLTGSKNVYEEIAERYRHYIRLGVLNDGEKLPSCRELAIQLGINPNTVERAYSLLESEGLVVTLPKKGTFAKKSENRRDIIDEAERQIAAIRRAGVTKEELEGIVCRIYG